MIMLAGVTVIFMTGSIATVSVAAHYRRSEPNIPEDCSVCGISSERDKINYMVVGGSPVKSARMYPWTVTFGDIFDLDCGGAIIDELHILTAAHCVKSGITGDLINITKVYFQTPSLKKMSHGISMEKIIAHPKYNVTESKSTQILVARYDIALVRLKEKIKCNAYKNPICLPDADFNLPLGAKSMIAGWGETNVTSMEYHPPRLHHGIVKRLDFAECIKAVPEAKNIKDHMLCEGGTKQTVCFWMQMDFKDISVSSIFRWNDELDGKTMVGWSEIDLSGINLIEGDSGTPLMHKIKGKYYAVGVASSETDPKCPPTKPTIFTDVVKFRHWIRKARKASFSSFKGKMNTKKQRCKDKRKIK